MDRLKAGDYVVAIGDDYCWGRRFSYGNVSYGNEVFPKKGDVLKVRKVEGKRDVFVFWHPSYPKKLYNCEDSDVRKATKEEVKAYLKKQKKKESK